MADDAGAGQRRARAVAALADYLGERDRRRRDEDDRVRWVLTMIERTNDAAIRSLRRRASLSADDERELILREVVVRALLRSDVRRVDDVPDVR
jgi:hypothetical protein